MTYTSTNFITYDQYNPPTDIDVSTLITEQLATLQVAVETLQVRVMFLELDNSILKERIKQLETHGIW